MVTGKAKEMMEPVTDPQKIKEILLNIENHALIPGITEVSIPDIVKQFKLLGIEFVIDEIFNKFFRSFIKNYYPLIFSHLYQALEQFCKENKGNQKLVLQQLAKLEQENELLSSVLKKLNENSDFLDFELQDNLLDKAIKFIEKKQKSSDTTAAEVQKKPISTPS